MDRRNGEIRLTQRRPYGYNVAQHLSDDTFAQQGHVTAEPLPAAAAGTIVDTCLLAGHGRSTNAATQGTPWDLVVQYPDSVQRFVGAPIERCGNLLYRDRPPPAKRP